VTLQPNASTDCPPRAEIAMGPGVVRVEMIRRCAEPRYRARKYIRKTLSWPAFRVRDAYACPELEVG